MGVKRLGKDGSREDERANLYMLCRDFIQEKDITCPESIWQVDRVTEDIEVFIEKICNTIGYARRVKA
jgi:hypothetical protein